MSSSSRAQASLLIPESKPVNSNSPSLLTLPGEIRNSIYKALYIRSEPMRVVQARSHVPGINLIATCQQTASEATPFLYTRNSFLVTAVGPDGYVEHLTSTAGKWLLSIGSQIVLVQSILIDTNASIASCRDVVDLLPILQPLWRVPNLTPKGHCPIKEERRRLKLSITAKGNLQIPRMTYKALDYFFDSNGFSRYLIQTLLPENKMLTYDLGNQRASLTLSSFLSTTYQARLAGEIVLDEYRASVKAISSTHTLKMSYDKLKVLQELDDDLSISKPSGLRCYPRPQTLELNFHTAKRVYLCEVRIDATALISATLKYPNETALLVNIKTEVDSSTPTTKKKLTLFDLRHNIKTFLSDRYGSSGGSQITRPDLWVDENGDVREAVLRAGLPSAELLLTNVSSGNHVWYGGRLLTVLWTLARTIPESSKMLGDQPWRIQSVNDFIGSCDPASEYYLTMA
ncbi:hypothetical protein EK21DRAFT_89707 [Setomelanomma holmii]|uniref:F-box domain-containing protein n=1 Tax=Setomelanomma holmii TaxID=210430 RepID=A0A9P4H7B0_9PLEO|nr:hypothetical protein EK21DRAFT_89707 [Setomelanomma holmii]